MIGGCSLDGLRRFVIQIGIKYRTKNKKRRTRIVCRKKKQTQSSDSVISAGRHTYVHTHGPFCEIQWKIKKKKKENRLRF